MYTVTLEGFILFLGDDVLLASFRGKDDEEGSFCSISFRRIDEEI